MKRTIAFLFFASLSLIIGGCHIFSHYNSNDSEHGYYDDSYELGGGSGSGGHAQRGRSKFPAVDYNPHTHEAQYSVPSNVPRSNA